MEEFFFLFNNYEFRKVIYSRCFFSSSVSHLFKEIKTELFFTENFLIKCINTYFKNLLSRRNFVAATNSLLVYFEYIDDRVKLAEGIIPFSCFLMERKSKVTNITNRTKFFFSLGILNILVSVVGFQCSPVNTKHSTSNGVAVGIYEWKKVTAMAAGCKQSNENKIFWGKEAEADPRQFTLKDAFGIFYRCKTCLHLLVGDYMLTVILADTLDWVSFCWNFPR